MRTNRALLAVALGMAIAHAAGEETPPHSAETVWDELIKAMCADNGCNFKPTPEQREAALVPIRRMIRAGFFREPNFQALNSSVWMMAAGEAFEKIQFFHNCDGYLELDRILEDVFNGEIE